MDRLFDDLLRGAAAISEELLGDSTEKNKRKIYHAHEKRLIPTFEFMGGICARRSTLRQHVAERERARAAASAENVRPENPDIEAREGRDALAKRARRMRTRTKHRAATDAAVTD